MPVPRPQLLLLLAACTGSEAPAPPADSGASDDANRVVSLPAPQDGYQVVTDPTEVPPYAEVEICTVVRVDPRDGERFAWVGRLESLVSPGTHHMNVFMGQFSFLDGYLGEGASEAALGVPLGTYDCADLSVMESAFPIFPSQRENQEIVFPPGVAVPLPAPLVLVFSHHFVNPHDYPVTINAALNVEAVPGSAVEQVAGIVFDGAPIELPAGQRSTAERTCVFDRDVSVALVSTHTHEWADCATLHHYEGADQGIEDRPFYANHDWDRPPILSFSEGAYDIQAGDGVHFGCHYTNDTDRTLVNDGTAEGEMCVFAAVTWPLPNTVGEVTSILEGGSLDALVQLMGDAMGPCAEVRDDLTGPWSADPTPLDGGTFCEGLPQTETTTLDALP